MISFDQRRFVTYAGGVGKVLNTIGSTIGGFMAASRQQDYYDGLRAAQAQSAANARKLQEARAVSMRTMAELSAEEYLNDASLAYQDATNVATAGEAQVRQTQRQVSKAIGQTVASQGASGFSIGTGSTLDAIRDLEDQGQRLVTTDFRTTLNNVTGLLREEARLKTAASITKFNTEEEIRFNKAETSALL